MRRVEALSVLREALGSDPDGSVWSDEELEFILDDALAQVNQVRPRFVVEEITLTKGTTMYDLVEPVTVTKVDWLNSAGEKISQLPGQAWEVWGVNDDDDGTKQIHVGRLWEKNNWIARVHGYRPWEWSTVEPIRFYFTNNNSTTETMDPDWDGAPGIEQTKAMVTSPSGTSNGTHSNDAVNLPVGYYHDEQYTFVVDADLLAMIQYGGTFRMQVRAKSRSGVGINEGAQNHYIAISMRILRAGVVIGTLVAVGDAVGTVKVDAFITENRSLYGSFNGVEGVQIGDRLIVEGGWRHLGPITGGTGCSFVIMDSSATDLPEDETTTSNFNTWLELRGAA